MSGDRGIVRHVTTVGLVLLCAVLMAPRCARGESGTVEVNGVSLGYDVEGRGTPLVLIHGWAVHRGYWDGDVGRLAQRHTVIRYDRRGFGESTGKPDPTADAADLKALLEALGQSRAHLVGHSQGATVALTFALRYPDLVGSLILCGSGPPIDLVLPAGEDTPPFAEWIGLAREQGAEAMKEALTAWSAEQFGDRSDAVAERARELLEPYTAADLIDPPQPANLAAPAGIQELGSVRAPTLVLIGDNEMPSTTIVADTLAYGIPGARKVVIPGGGHTINWSEPERFAAEVLRFARRAEEEAGSL